MGVYGRRAGGQGLGAIHGEGPDFGIGLPLSVGFSLHDDFLPQYVKPGEQQIGEQRWEHTHTGGTGTFASVAPTAHTEAGILQVVSANLTNSSTIVHQGPYTALYRFPPPGSIWGCKLRIADNSPSYEVWSGFASLTNAPVSTASATQFIGIRATNGNVFGVLKDGAGAANETLVDLGSTAVGAWRTFGFYVYGTTLTPRFQFFQINQLASDRAVYDRIDIGGPVLANRPLVPLSIIAIGVTGLAQAGQADVSLDWWGFGGRVAR